MKQYQYTVKEVFESTMLVEYDLGDGPKLLVGMPLPRGAMTLERTIDAHAPVGSWDQGSTAVVTPSVGATATLVAGFAAPPSLELSRVLKYMALSQWRQAAENAGLMIDGELMPTDPVSQIKLNAAVLHSKGKPGDRLMRGAGGKLKSVTKAKLQSIAETIDNYNYALDQVESGVAAQIEAATTIEQVEAIVMPS